MCAYIYEWIRGYTIDRTVSVIPNSATHILSFESNSHINTRKYSTRHQFSTQKLRKLEMAYNNFQDIVYTDGLSTFGNLTLLEFLHTIIPGEEVNIYHIPVLSYKNNRREPEFSELFSPHDYICTCLQTTETCVFHKFMTEKLYTKYTKNDSSLSYPNCSYHFDNDWGMV